jgi:hypothetical protein
MPQDSIKSQTLLPQHAFVVQLCADTQVETGQLRGRVEHVVSRQATSFESLEVLLAFMARILREVQEASTGSEGL